MVRRRLTGAIAAFAAFGLGSLVSISSAACGREGEMAEHMEMPDSTTIMRAIEDAEARDSMLDTMPGGEMARGDSLAEMKLLREKMWDGP